MYASDSFSKCNSFPHDPYRTLKQLVTYLSVKIAALKDNAFIAFFAE